jgi:hypothetical protein
VSSSRSLYPGCAAQGLDYEGWPNGPFGKAAGKPDGWFTEGDDMHDLKEAKALLKELHA